ncbi:amino acid adenylation domain-containing protein, partial [Actinoplanes sp. NPDC049548]|uniref:amino acid adenylation domain-containing protein n=1 Tax=Actinoplanes sp. NPDC049548 TaxID=3155152 RepID=UPI003447964B
DTDLAAYGNQDIPFERLVDDLAPARSLSRNPLFQVMFAVHQNTGLDDRWSLAGVATRTRAGSPEAARFDLSVDLAERRDPQGRPAGLAGDILYATDLFDERTVRALAARLVAVFAQVAADPEVRIGDLDLLDAQERVRVLQQWNDTAVAVPAVTVPELFAAQVARTPDTVAVRCGVDVLTYAQLAARSDAWAAYLAGRGAGPETLVALLLPRGVDMVAAMLGVWKAGAAFVPLDPAYPAQRLAQIVADSGAELVVDTDVDLSLGGAPVPVVHVDQDALAYVIYTSGSTGVPKGVAVTHRGVANLASVMAPVLGAGAVTLQFASFSFDASILDIAVTLTSGGTLAIATAEQRQDVHALSAMIRDAGVEVASVVPSLLAVLDPAEVPGVRNWVLGAERLSAELANRWTAHTRVWNTYGPTEATVITTAVPLGSHADVAPPIGAPIGNTRVFVLDEFLNPVPPGVTGEVHIAGAGLARGYLGRAGLTAASFIAGPDGERWYRSGDVGRWDPDGLLHFVGRVDEQVKIRGLRVEPGEVAAVLETHEQVSQAVVVVRDGRLVAYVVSTVEPDVLKAYAAERLPDYMVPAAVVALEALPLTVNGKLDRTALPAPDAMEVGRGPQTPAEELFCALFAEVLGVQEVGAEASFFDLGGDSIMSMLLVSKARRAGLAVTARQIFEQQTPAGLARAAVPSADRPRTSDTGTGDVPLTPVMRELLDETGPEGLGELVLATTVVTPPDADPTALDGAVRALLAHHDMLRARLEQDGDDWHLTVPEATTTAGSPLRRIDVAGRDIDEVMAEHARAAAARIDPRAGVMVDALWFDAGPERAGRLLLTIAHLVVDTVSLRILLPDLHEAYAALASGREVALQPVPTSFRHWARELIAEDRTAELPAWIAMVGEPDPRPAEKTGTVREIAVRLSADTTAELLSTVPAAFHAGVDDVLLTGLAVAVVDCWRAARGVLIDVEGHGRIPLSDGDDLSRTTGWFTVGYPVRLDPGPVNAAEVRAGGDAAGRAVKRIKEQLRAVPGDGLGYGLLRYLNPATAPGLAGLARAQIGFNYLGRLPAAEGVPQPWQAAGPPPGDDNGEPVRHALELKGVVHDLPEGPRLLLTLTWPERALTEAAAHDLLDGWAAALAGLAAHAARPDAGGHTPSDFALLDLDQSQIDELESTLADEWSGR